MKIIPAIDILGGRCVRLSQGDYATRKVYNEDPLEVAKAFEGSGIRYLHLVDLDGAKSSHIVNHQVLEQIASKTQLKIDFGGGLKSDKDVAIAFECGASQITGGSIAIQNKALFLTWLDRYGPAKIILGADCRNRRIATQGWLQGSDTDVIDFIQSFEAEGISEVISTDIAKDGMLGGPSLSLYQEILTKTRVALIASGGVASVSDLVALKELGCQGAIVGKAFYEGRITLKELSDLC
ncbi:MAG: 1-(5-phosphoribosyl)-5-[(5-phosphoribosylamino)methylideneamino]imidazole-4-carboxamide isomerase [Bacteroidetes bacterium]|nr:MAG: 1-(5-phosphoribosyl)-5-[(5-phosphoribosylamino)methylideneamino]imidazole-4-carboxamide isomerase [Bacteroidota bacterium]